MKWLDTLERKLDRFSIGNLMQYICLTMAAFYIFAVIQPGVPIFSLIALSPYRIMQGQIWRLITFVFMPPATGLFAFLIIYFYYVIGRNLEYYWGTTRFNLYYLFGMIGAILAAFITHSTGTNSYLNLSLLLAYTALFPDNEEAQVAGPAGGRAAGLALYYRKHGRPGGTDLFAAELPALLRTQAL